MSNASKVPAAGHDDPGAATPHGVDLASRFRLDEQQARTWLAATIAACEAWNAAPDFGEPDEEAPHITTTWDPRQVGEEASVWRLVRYAADNGIIVRPDGMDVDFIYLPAYGDGGMYHFAVDVGDDYVKQVTLASFGHEMRKLVDDETTGAEAALNILAEAVEEANSALRRLAVLFAEWRSAQSSQSVAADERQRGQKTT